MFASKRARWDASPGPLGLWRQRQCVSSSFLFSAVLCVAFVSHATRKNVSGNPTGDLERGLDSDFEALAFEV